MAPFFFMHSRTSARGRRTAPHHGILPRCLRAWCALAFVLCLATALWGIMLTGNKATTDEAANEACPTQAPTAQPTANADTPETLGKCKPYIRPFLYTASTWERCISKARLAATYNNPAPGDPKPFPCVHDASTGTCCAKLGSPDDFTYTHAAGLLGAYWWAKPCEANTYCIQLCDDGTANTKAYCAKGKTPFPTSSPTPAAEVPDRGTSSDWCWYRRPTGVTYQCGWGNGNTALRTFTGSFGALLCLAYLVPTVRGDAHDGHEKCSAKVVRGLVFLTGVLMFGSFCIDLNSGRIGLHYCMNEIHPTGRLPSEVEAMYKDDYESYKNAQCDYKRYSANAGGSLLATLALAATYMAMKGRFAAAGGGGGGGDSLSSRDGLSERSSSGRGKKGKGGKKKGKAKKPDPLARFKAKADAVRKQVDSDVGRDEIDDDAELATV